MNTEGRAKVLVADDTKDIVESVSFCLQQRGYQVITAFDGAQALEVARAEEPDLMVLDVMMPKENGYQVARLVREDEKSGIISKRTRILMLTARTTERRREEFLQTWSGADAFMYKPFDLDELMGCVDELLARQRRTS
jgi:two-component system response regulator VicR